MAITRRSVLGFTAGSMACLVPRACRAAADSLAGEAKLARSARIEAEGVPISHLLAEISEETEVELTSRGLIGDEKVVVFGPRRPVRDTLADLGALFNATWRQERSATGVRYVLELGTAAQRHERKLARARLDALMARVDAHVRALRESTEQLAKRPQGDLTRRMLSDPQGRLPTEFFALLSPAQREQLFVRRRLNVPFGALNATQQDALRRIWGNVLEAEATYFASPEGMANTIGFIRRQPGDIERGFLRMRVQRIGGSALIGMFAGGFPVAAEAVTNETGRPGFSTSGWPIYFVEGKDTWLLPPHGNPYTGDPVGPDFQFPKNLVLGEAQEWIETLRGLAEKTGRPVLSDFYRMPSVVTPPAVTGGSEARPEVGLLDGLCQHAGYLWWPRGSTLLCRKRDWFDQRPYEVPDRWFSEVARELGSEHRMTTAVVRLVLQLSPEQAAGLYSLRERSTTEEPEELYPVRALLRLIEAGDPTGKRFFPAVPAVTAGAVPDFAPAVTAVRLTPRQQQLVPGFLAETDGMIGTQLPPAFRAWLSTSAAIRPASRGKLPMLDLEVRWSFAVKDRVKTLRLPLPAIAPEHSLRIEF